MWTFKCHCAHFKMLDQFAKLPSRKTEPIYNPFKVYKCTYYLKPSSTLVIIFLLKIFQFYRLKGIFILALIDVLFITSEVEYFLCLLAIYISLFCVTCRPWFNSIFLMGFLSSHWFLRLLHNSKILTLCHHVCCEFFSQFFITLTL